MRTVTGTVSAFLSEYHGPEELLDSDANRVVAAITYTNIDLSTHGYALVGSAEITLHIKDEDDIVLSKIDSLEKSITAIQARAEMEITKVREKIQCLKAITYKAEE
jgi:hypothetical protein